MVRFCEAIRSLFEKVKSLKKFRIQLIAVELSSFSGIHFLRNASIELRKVIALTKIPNTGVRGIADLKQLYSAE